jgi:hypothetical protein
MAPPSAQVRYRFLPPLNLNAPNRRAQGHRKAAITETPIIVLLLSLLILLCMVAAILTVNLFDRKWALHRPESQQPPVLLGIISSINGLCLGVLLTAGIAVSWWRNAAHGTDIECLHLIWEHGQGRGILSALAIGMETRRVVLVAIVVVAARFMTG